MKQFLPGLIICCALVPMQAFAQKGNRALPDNNLAYPILVTLKNSKGSGFYLNSGTAIYLVTAKHVLFDSATRKLLEPSFDLLSYSSDLSDTTPNLFSVDATKLPAENVIPHPSQDVAVIKLFKIMDAAASKLESLPGLTAQTIAKTGIVSVDRQNVKTFDDVLIGNDVILLGYPTSLGLQIMPQIDPNRPLLRKGIVAGENPKTHSIVLDCPVYFGNSGGPVLEADPLGLGHKFVVIGVVDQYVPYADGGKTFAIMANSGYSVAVPMDYILELIK